MVNWGVITGIIAVIIIIAIVLLVLKRKSNSSLYSKVNQVMTMKEPMSQETHRSLSSTSISQGQKEQCAVLALRVRNNHEISTSGSNAQETIKIALTRARNAGASVFEQNDFKIAVIPSSAAKENLPLLAAKLTKEIGNILEEHNKKYSQKIDYGFGANIGELIVEKSNGKYKFNSIGTTIQLAKRIADTAKDEAFISEPIRNAAMKDIKVEKKGEYWAISRIIARDAHNEFINKFMERQRRSQ